jgi:predicted CxxxxCH...CXXCH cytochrome family protein
MGPFGHPTGWSSPTMHGAAAKQDLTKCVVCHAKPYNAGPGDNPRFNVAIGNLAQGCETCHATNTAHPVPWQGPTYSHATAANFTKACGLCHGATLNGGTAAPACMSCHTNGSPVNDPSCTSCHATPPSGSVAPNRSGAHATHNALAGVANVCNTCHNGAGSGTDLHDNGTVNVSFLSSYNAKSGTAVHNGDGTCSNVSCHGGQTTPVWLTGSIDVATQCTSCHAYGTSQYNSYVSGQHGYHVNTLGITCVECHDTSRLAVSHFSALSTPQLEGPASATLNSSLNYDATTTSCSNQCHGTDYWVQ